MSRIKIEVITKQTDQGEDTYGRYVKAEKGKKVGRGAIDKFVTTYSKLITPEREADRIIQGMSDLSLHAVMTRFAIRAGSKHIESVYGELRQWFGRLPAGAADCVYDMQSIQASKVQRPDEDDLEVAKRLRRRRADHVISILAKNALWGNKPITVKEAYYDRDAFDHEHGYENTGLYVDCRYDGTDKFTVVNNQCRGENWLGRIRTNKDGSQNRADLNYYRDRMKRRNNYSNVRFTRGFIHDFYRDPMTECGRVPSDVPGIKHFVLAFSPEQIKGNHYGFAAGFHDGYMWLYVIRLQEREGRWVAVEAKKADKAEVNDAGGTVHKYWAVSRGDLTQFVTDMYHGGNE